MRSTYRFVHLTIRNIIDRILRNQLYLISTWCVGRTLQKMELYSKLVFYVWIEISICYMGKYFDWE